MGGAVARARVGGRFKFEAFDKNGKHLWTEEAHNLVVDVGLQEIIDVVLLAGTQHAAWYVGLTSGTPTIVAGDTLASHGGWTEITDYTGNRKAYSGVRSGQTSSNAASTADFVVNADNVTIGGGFLASVDTGTSGVLLCAVAFTGGNKILNTGDTLKVTYTFTAADDGV